MKQTLLQMHPDLSEIEAEIIETIIEDALQSDYCLSIWDGEEWAVKMSQSKERIYRELAATAADRLVFRNAETKAKVGWVDLIYGNQEDLVSDYSAYPEIETLLERADAIANAYTG